jgi:hypothetical protein
MTTTAYSPNDTSRDEAAVSIRRFVNDEVAQVASRLDGNDGSSFEFVCECGELGCHAVVKMTLAQYRSAQRGSILGH